jgi:hypothetical protein
MDDAFAVSRMPENGLSGSMWREPETEMTVRSSGTLAPKGRNSQGSQDLQHPPRRLPTRLLQLSRRAGTVLQNAGVRATLGAGRLRAPGPAGLRRGGAALQQKLSPFARPEELGDCVH